MRNTNSIKEHEVISIIASIKYNLLYFSNTVFTKSPSSWKNLANRGFPKYLNQGSRYSHFARINWLTIFVLFLVKFFSRSILGRSLIVVSFLKSWQDLWVNIKWHFWFLRLGHLIHFCHYRSIKERVIPFRSKIINRFLSISMRSIEVHWLII